MLRVLFNIIIGALGLWLSWGISEKMGGMKPYLAGIVMYGITVNVFFSIGPLAEIYLGVLKSVSLGRFRLPLFVIGTLFSALVTFLVYSLFEMSLHPNSGFGAGD